MPRLLAMILLTIVCMQAQAHTLSVSYLDVAVPANGGDVQVELDLSLRDLALTLPLDANGDEQVTWGELVAIRSPLESLVQSQLAITSRDGRCTLRPHALATRSYAEGTYATLQLRARCPSLEGLQIRYSLLFDLDPQHRAIVTMRRGARVDTAIARPDASTLRFDQAASHAFTSFLREGIRHILIGYDHLAFLVSLLLPAVLVRSQGRWHPRSDRRGSFLHVVGIVTAFTLAHSITLSLAALGLVSPASRGIEIAIALSVLLAALNNIKPIVSSRMWLVGLGFGLIHGFGFAGALAELGVPSQSRIIALLGFNLGVETGQLLVICLVMPILFAVRKRDWYARVAMPALSLGIAALAAWWLQQRFAG